MNREHKCICGFGGALRKLSKCTVYHTFRFSAHCASKDWKMGGKAHKQKRTCNR